MTTLLHLSREICHPSFFFGCRAEAEQVWQTRYSVYHITGQWSHGTLKAPASAALKIGSTNEQGMEKGPCSVILEMDPSHTMVTSPQVGPTFFICNSNPRREHRGQDWVLDYICEVTIAMQLEEARWQPSTFENWICVRNCLNFTAEAELEMSVLDVCGSHIDVATWRGGGSREGSKRAREIFPAALREVRGSQILH